MGVSLAIAALLVGTRGQSQPVIARTPHGQEFVAGRLLVRMREPKGSLASLQRLPGVRLGQFADHVRTAILEIGKGADVLKTCELVRKLDGVQSAAPDYVRRAKRAPNDPLFTQQWNLDTCRFTAMWDVYRGSNTLEIAVLDSGLNINLPDFAGRLKPGRNFVTGGSNVTDVTGHGTAVAAVAGATCDNGFGVAGAGWNTSIRPFKVADDSGRYFDSAALLAINACIANPQVRALNMSFGGEADSPTFAAAVDDAVNAGIVVVSSAGNFGVDTPYFPAAYPSVIAVGATNFSDERAIFAGDQSSNYGDWVDVAAPGYQVEGFDKTGTFTTFDGTSFAAPQVAALAAQLSGLFGPRTALTSKYVRAYIQNSCRYVGDWVHFGRIDAWQAIQQGLLYAPTRVSRVPSIGPRSESDIAGLIVEPDGSATLAGSVGEGATLRYSVTRWNRGGTRLWTTEFSYAGLGDVCNDIKELSSGAIVAVGRSNTLGNKTRATLVRLTPQGAVFGTWAASGVNSEASTLACDSSGAAYVGGTTSGLPWAMKVSSTQSLVWSATLVHATACKVTKLVLDEVNGWLYAIGSYSNQKGWFVSRVNTKSGAVYYTKYIPSTKLGAVPRDCKLVQGSLIVVGGLADPIGIQPTISKINTSTGTVVAGNVESGLGGFKGEFRSLCVTSQGLLAATGTVKLVSQGPCGVTSLYDPQYLSRKSTQTFSAFGDANTGAIDSGGLDVAPTPNGGVFVAGIGYTGNRSYNVERVAYDGDLSPCLFQRYWDGAGRIDVAKKAGSDALGHTYSACFTQNPDGSRDLVLVKD